MDNKRDTAIDLGNELTALDEEISRCFKCRSQVADFQKPEPINRGSKANIMIIGQNPGKTELTSGSPFSGQSGKRLNEWLIKSGADEDNPRQNVYCTSIVKCFVPKMKSFALMARNCRSFLNRQVQMVRPTLIITLGQRAYEELNLSTITYNDAICKVVRTSDQVLITSLGFHFEILAWPHPSGLNRWHNVPSNKVLIEATFATVNRHWKGSK